MSKTDKGVLIFNEWFELMKQLSATDFKKLLVAMYEYQRYGKEPPQFKGKSELVATLVFPAIKRRISLSSAGKRGAQVTNSRERITRDYDYFVINDDGSFDVGYGDGNVKSKE